MHETESRANLEKQFRATDYAVMLPHGEEVLRIGHHDADADREIIAQAGCHHRWFVLTPCNPEAERVSDAANRFLLQEFHKDLRAWGGTWYATLSRPDREGAPEEPGAFIVDAEPAWVHQLAKKYRQRAYLAAELGNATQLVWLEG